MKPSDLYKSEILIESFGESRVFATVREMRTHGYFPAHTQHVTAEEVGLLVYCLCCNDAVSDTGGNIEKYFSLTAPDGLLFNHAFIVALSDREVFAHLEQMCFIKESGKVIMCFINNGQPEATIFKAGPEQADNGLSTHTMIEQAWLKKLRDYATRHNLKSALENQLN